MSNIQSRVYEDAVTVTLSDTVADPAGPFAGLLVTNAGTVKVTTIRGTTQSLGTWAAGSEIHIAVSRVWSTGTGATVLGLVSPPYKPAINPGAGTVL